MANIGNKKCDIPLDHKVYSIITTRDSKNVSANKTELEWYRRNVYYPIGSDILKENNVWRGKLIPLVEVICFIISSVVNDSALLLHRHFFFRKSRFPRGNHHCVVQVQVLKGSKGYFYAPRPYPQRGFILWIRAVLLFLPI